MSVQRINQTASVVPDAGSPRTVTKSEVQADAEVGLDW